MIHIDCGNIEADIPPEWKEKAQRALDELRPLSSHEERQQYIDKKADLWRELKDILFQVSHKKCWYCEAREDRSDYHVDHFRPKLRVRDESDQVVECEGYWWLVFDWHNFRLSCNYCNTRHKGEDGRSHGKWDRFPVRDENYRAKTPDDNIQDEMPLLLDPTVLGESELLLFMEDGQAYPAVPEGTFPYQRAEFTIDALFLNDVRITDARKGLWGRCGAIIARGDKAFKDYCNGSPSGMGDFRKVCEEIKEMISPKAEYSAAARACFRSRKEEWLRQIV